ncbi:MAG TPA: S4 domain-containing protein [Petrotogaceae bacterium]|jgi:ribosomal 50S subunit-recycling heat shock protein|nr:S4 domain-containing protein [Petrotogaceae bacterium]
MRLDKYLADIRIVKRRVVAHDMCESGKVMRNGMALKPGHEIKIGDTLDVQLAKKTLKITVSGEKEFEVIQETIRES